MVDSSVSRRFPLFHLKIGRSVTQFTTNSWQTTIFYGAYFRRTGLMRRRETDYLHRSCRKFSIIPGNADNIVSTSSSVLSLPSVRRRLPCANSTGRCIASSTCDGSTEPEVHAEPVEAAIPSRSRLSRIDSPSTPSKTKLALLGKRSVG